MKNPHSIRGFTLIELLTVIAIIAVLMGLLFSAMSGVKDAGKKAKAKNEVTQIANSIRQFNNEYGKYPTLASSGTEDVFAGNDANHKLLFDILRNDVTTGSKAQVEKANPRGIAFIETPPAKGSAAAPTEGLAADGKFYDPWGSPYRIVYDASYNNQIANPYTSGAGPNILRTGVIAWSVGKDAEGALGATGGGDKTAGTGFDDIISWQ